MKTILCFGDSNTYGYIPGGNDGRYPREVRWPGKLQMMLGEEYHVVEEGLNGRTTAFGDDIEPYRKGLDTILPCVMSHAPDLIVIMLGTNDTKERFHVCAEEIGYGMEELVMKITGYYQFHQQKPQILIISPVPIGKTEIVEFNEQSIEKSKKLAPIYKDIANRFGCRYLNASDYVKGLGCDKIHFNPEHHAALSEGIFCKVKEILG